MIMPRFQSQLFNWIDNSLPAQWGRRVRDWYDQTGNPVKQATETIKKNTTKVILYPVYILASATNLRSPSRNVPLLLKPVQSLVVWIDRHQIFRNDSIKKTVNKPKTSQKYLSTAQTSRKPFISSAKSKALNSNNHHKNQENFNRIEKLIKEAIAYFFGKKPHKSRLSSTTKNLPKISIKPEIKQAQNPQPWLTMADIFVDDATAWPPHVSENTVARNIVKNENLSSLELSPDQSLSLNKTANKITTSTSQELQNSSIPATESSRPMYAWLETQATFLGYVSSPFVAVLNWLDRLIANIEKWIIKFWQQLVKLLFGI